MIPGTSVLRQTPAWQRELALAVADPAELLRILDLDPALLSPARAAARDFPLRVPRGYVARMRRGDVRDPLLRQVLPLGEETLAAPGFGTDPVGDLSAQVAPGVLHKYRGRVLLTATGACAVHCRYCFRRHFPYTEANASAGDWEQALAYIGAQGDVEEVILSGGDPLTLSDRRLLGFVARLAALPQVRRVRLHTRLPIVLPERVTDALLDGLAGTRLAAVMVVHANHAQEIDTGVRAALIRLRDAGVTVLNQSVLLRGVNDDAGALVALSEALFDAGVLPYYLHLLDRVQGAAHFEVPADEALALMAAVSARLPGYLVPRLVREQAGAPAKLAVGLSDGAWEGE